MLLPMGLLRETVNHAEFLSSHFLSLGKWQIVPAGTNETLCPVTCTVLRSDDSSFYKSSIFYYL